MVPPPDAAPPPHPWIRELLLRFPPEQFQRGETLIENTRHQAPRAGAGSLAYIVEGLVRGAWSSPFIAPDHHATTIVAGDGRWVGADAFKYEANLFRYDSLTVCESLRAQGRSILDFVVETLIANSQRGTPPSLMPST